MVNRDLVRQTPNENVVDYPDVLVTPELETYTFDSTRIDIFKENIRLEEDFSKLEAIANQSTLPTPKILEGISMISNVLVRSAKKSFLPKKRLIKLNSDRKTNKKSGIIGNARAINRPSGDMPEKFLLHLLTKIP